MSSIERAARLHSLAFAHNSVGHPSRAARTLQQALGVLADVESADAAFWRARVLITLGLAEAELHGLERGLDALARATPLIAEQPTLRTLAAMQRGLLLLRNGRDDAALAAFDEAEQGFGYASALDKCMTWLNRSVSYINRSKLAAAREDLQRCANLAEAEGLAMMQAKALYNLGYVAFLSGDLPCALQLMDSADRLSVEVNTGVALLDRARVLSEAGLLREADDVLAEAAAIFRQDRVVQDLAETELARARCALLAGQPAAANRLARRARSRFQRRRNERWRCAADLVVVSAQFALGRDIAGVARQLASELAVQGQQSQARTAAFLAAEALLDRGRVAEAQRIATAAGIAGRREPISARLHSRYLRARLARASGDATHAVREVRAGLADLAAYQASFGSIDLQTASAIHGRRLAELGRAIAIEQGSPGRVLAAVERGRAVSSRLQSVCPPADERTAELLAELRRTIEELRNADGGSATATQLAQHRRRLEREINARSWSMSGAGAAERTAPVGAIRAGLTAAGASLACYLRVGSTLHAVVLGPRRASLHDLGPAAPVEDTIRRARADLDVLAYGHLPAGLRAAARGSLDRAMAELNATLVTPLRLDAERLLVTPTGALAMLPWSMLPSLTGVPTTVAPTATAWLAASTARSRPGGAVVAVTGPGLNRADDEARSVAETWPSGRALPGAGRDAFTDALASAAVVHVAAHGTHQTENPLFSSIRLADGALFAYELEHAAPHVILSACELGLATVRPGDEALGLTSVLLRLGTSCVVASVGRVHDDAAADVMTGYHASLAAGADSAAALASAVTAHRGEAPAPFVCFGATWQAVGS